MYRYDFTQRGIPVLQHYLEEKVSATSKQAIDDCAFANEVCSMVTSTNATRARCRISSCRSCGERCRLGLLPGTSSNSMYTMAS